MMITENRLLHTGFGALDEKGLHVSSPNANKAFEVTIESTLTSERLFLRYCGSEMQ
jgi:hypothetical protein